MKVSLALFAILAVIGLSQTHQVPDFGEGPLHEDIQDIFDLIPMQKVADIFLDYLANDTECQEAAKRLSSSTVLKDLVVDVEAIPEAINLLNFLQKEGIDIYYIVNRINKVFGLPELVPSASYASLAKRTGGVAGFFKDIKALFDYDDYMRIYVEKMQTSPAFVRFVQQLKSNNFQQIVNKIYPAKSFQLILNALHQYGVNTQFVGDILYIVFDITVPKYPYDRSLSEEMQDFTNLIPWKKFIDIQFEYAKKDEKIREAIVYIFMPEFHDLLRAVEALKEHQTLITFLEKCGLNVIEFIQEFHRMIGMDEYVPPKIENRIGVQKIGEGMRGMFNDLTAILPTEKIQALYDEKMSTDNAFSDFVKKMMSLQMKTLLFNLYGEQAYQELVTKSMEHELDFKAMAEFSKKVIPIPYPVSVL